MQHGCPVRSLRVSNLGYKRGCKEAVGLRLDLRRAGSGAGTSADLEKMHLDCHHGMQVVEVDLQIQAEQVQVCNRGWLAVRGCWAAV